jgi:hypothetical protein
MTVDYARSCEAQQGSTELLTRLNEEFAVASRRAKVPFDDARLLLVNGVAI